MGLFLCNLPHLAQKKLTLIIFEHEDCQVTGV